MSKKATEVSINGKPVFYTILYSDFRSAALKCGYALALHGTMATDMDLIAVPWTENPTSVETLVSAISDCIGKTIWKGHHFTQKELKPHGRIGYTLSIYSDWYVDLSVIQPHPPLNQ